MPSLLHDFFYSELSDEQVRAVKNILENFSLNQDEVAGILKGFPRIQLPEKLVRVCVTPLTAPAFLPC